MSLPNGTVTLEFYSDGSLLHTACVPFVGNEEKDPETNLNPDYNPDQL